MSVTPVAVYNIRETASAALFTQLQTITNFSTAKRKFEMWDSVVAADRPALRMLETGEVITKTPGGVWTITTTVQVCIYWDAPQETDAIPATQMNLLLASLELAMRPNLATMRLDLGLYPGVQDAWIEGDVIKDPGDLDGTGLIMAPVKMLLEP